MVERMLTMKSVIVLVFLCVSTISCKNILQANDAENVCFKQVLSEIIKDENSVAIGWSNRTCESIKDEILKTLSGKIDFIIMNWSLEISNWHMSRKYVTDPILIVVSTKADIINAILSLFKKSVWSGTSKFIILFMDESGNGRKSSTDPFIKDILQTLANLNALSVRIIYKYNDGIDEFTWFPYEDSNCETVHFVRLISECKDEVYQNHAERLKITKLKSKCSTTAAIQPMEPYSFYSKNSGFSKGLEVYLLREFAKWSNIDVDMQRNDNINAIQEVDYMEKYVPCPMPQVAP